MSMSIPFHVPSVPKPQDVFRMPSDNSNTPFGFTLPSELTRFSADVFVDLPCSTGNRAPVEPSSLESTKFTYIDTEDGLKMLRSKLLLVDEFAVDLEANSYRSFQGMTCLMQISTRTEDFVVDTLKLHSSVGYYLEGLFLDPTKRKVMHGAGNDILWLQRDFGIYVCNLFDTMQASRVLRLDRNSLEHLLVYFCGVKANKQYQTSDWRIRPLPAEMLHYAREDTHYLLYIYDKMRLMLEHGTGFSGFDNPLLEVYEGSHEVCCSLYEKELFTEDSYKNLFGLNEMGFSREQLNVVARLYKWRDQTARKNDESTGYIMPNKLLLELSQKLPKTHSEFLSIINRHNSKNHPFVEENKAELLNIIRNSCLDSEIDCYNNNRRSLMRAHGGNYVTPVYPQPCYVKAIRVPGVCLPVQRPLVVHPFFFTAPRYPKFVDFFS